MREQLINQAHKSAHQSTCSVRGRRDRTSRAPTARECSLGARWVRRGNPCKFGVLKSARSLSPFPFNPFSQKTPPLFTYVTGSLANGYGGHTEYTRAGSFATRQGATQKPLKWEPQALLRLVHPLYPCMFSMPPCALCMNICNWLACEWLRGAH